MLQECFKKANQYDNQLLSLLYGSVGLISLDSRTDGLAQLLGEEEDGMSRKRTQNEIEVDAESEDEIVKN